LARFRYGGQVVMRQIGEMGADLGRRYTKDSLAKGVYAAGAIYREEVPPFAARQNHPLLYKCPLKTPSAIGALEAVPKSLAMVAQIDPKAARLLFLVPGWSVGNRTFSRARNLGQAEVFFQAPADALEMLFEERQGLGREPVMVDA
jgi:hypothetical protein